MRAGLCLPGLPEHSIAYSAGWKQLGFRTRSFRLFGETFFEGRDVLETASLLLHGAAPY